MVAKKARQGKILEIVRRHQVRSQQELSSLLGVQGVPVTQSTLSRDIRELGLIKAQGRYRAAGETLPGASNGNLRRALQQYVLSTEISGNIVVIKTSPGNAHSVCVLLDAAQWPDVLGTVAGDDTIFVLARNGRSARKVLDKIRASGT